MEEDADVEESRELELIYIESVVDDRTLSALVSCFFGVSLAGVAVEAVLGSACSRDSDVCIPVSTEAGTEEAGTEEAGLLVIFADTD